MTDEDLVPLCIGECAVCAFGEGEHVMVTKDHYQLALDNYASVVRRYRQEAKAKQQRETHAAMEQRAKAKQQRETPHDHQDYCVGCQSTTDMWIEDVTKCDVCRTPFETGY